MLRLLLSLCFVLLADLASANSVSSRIRTIAIGGISHPELPTGSYFGDFVVSTSGGDTNAPVVNNNGQTTFFADLVGEGVSTANDGSLWRDDNSALKLLAREGEQAPGAPAGTVFASIRGGYPAIGGDGTIVFGAAVRTAAQELKRGVWRAKGDNVELLALEGLVLPANSNMRADGVVDDYRINDSGEIALWLRQSEVHSGTRRDGIYFFSGNSVVPLAETGRTAIGIGRNYRNIMQTTFALNDLGDVAFVGQVEATGMQVNSDTGVWLADGAAQRLIAREGDAAPGQPPGTVFSNPSVGTPFGSPLSMNGAGTLLFSSALIVPNVGISGGTWKYQGQTTSNLESPYSILGTGDKPAISINDAGTMAYIARIAGMPEEKRDAVVRDFGATREIVAQAGFTAPGAPVGSVFVEFSKLPAGLGLNANDQIAFQAFYRDPAEPELQRGIWAENGQGQLTLVARTGGALEVAPNDFREILRLYFAPGSGNTGGHRSGFDDIGGLAFTADFTDGTSGMFAYHPVPEPSSFAIVLAAFAGLSCLGRANR